MNAASFADRPLSLQQARHLHLHAQGLLQPSKRKARRDDLIHTIARMRLLQIDSIHVVARSPYLVLHSRLGDYPQGWLDDALAAGRIAESWAHEACFVTAADIGWHRRWRELASGMHWSDRSAERAREENQVQMDALLERIRVEGPMRAADFERAEPAKSGWWSWKPEKRWLEAWFAAGALMVTRRERFQRVYDVAERVLAALDPAYHAAHYDESPAQLRERFLLDSVRALGITQARWIADYFRLKPAVTDAELAPLVAAGKLLSCIVSGWKTPAYVHPDHAQALQSAQAGRLRATHTCLLSPFDPVVWDRNRARELFGFDYSIECYVPEAKRSYGYYVLPILHRGHLIGRLDAKAHRARGEFEIKALFLEPETVLSERLIDELARALQRTAAWHATPDVTLSHCRPASAASLLRRALRNA